MSEFLCNVAWASSLLFSLAVAPLILLSGMSAAESAVQECSAAALAPCFAVIPYCAARAVSGLNR